MSIVFQLLLWVCAVAAGQGIIIGLVLLNSGYDTARSKLLGWLMLLFAAALATYVMNMYHYDWTYNPGYPLTWMLICTFGPLLLWYIRLEYGLPFTIRYAYLHAIPFVFYLLQVLVFFATGKKTVWLPGSSMALSSIFILLVYVLLGLYNYYRHSGKVVHISTGRQVTRFTRVEHLLYFFGMYALTLCLYIVCRLFHWPMILHVSLELKILLTVAIYYTAYQKIKANQNRTTLPEAIPVGEAVPKYKTSTLSIETGDYIIKRVSKLMDTERLYLQKDLRLSEVAQQLGTSPNYLSQAINERIGLSFPDYVNKYRIEAAQQLLASADLVKITAIPAQTGFTNKTSFNKAFKKFTGLTPTEYKIRSQQQSESSSSMVN
jgi:AraC-like DNA-binding protein